MVSTKIAAAKNTDQYLKALPEKERSVLDKLRQTIRSAAPTAEEAISYQIPVFKYKGNLVGFAAFKAHCSFFVMSSTVLKNFSDAIIDYKTATGTIQFTVDQPLPSALVKKIVTARMKENEEILLAGKEKKTIIKKSPSFTSEAEKVLAYMNKLEHPLKPEIEAVRTIIKGANKKISERIKWNAPSYYYLKDLVTFNQRAADKVHLVFHYAGIVQIQSALLQGDYKDRRMAYFTNMADVQSKKKELERIINELVKIVDG